MRAARSSSLIVARLAPERRLNMVAVSPLSQAERKAAAVASGVSGMGVGDGVGATADGGGAVESATGLGLGSPPQPTNRATNSKQIRRDRFTMKIIAGNRSSVQQRNLRDRCTGDAALKGKMRR
jgi:hypothetical protein